MLKRSAADGSDADNELDESNNSAKRIKKEEEVDLLSERKAALKDNVKNDGDEHDEEEEGDVALALDMMRTSFAIFMSHATDDDVCT